MSRRNVVLAVAVAAIGALALARLLASDGRTDEDLIRVLIEDGARAAEEKRIGDAVAGLSERFRGEGLDKSEVKRLVAFHVLRGESVSVSIAGSRIRVEGARARAGVDTILVRGSGRGKALASLLPNEAGAHRFDLALEREEDGWRIVAADWRPIDLAEALAGPPDPGAPR
jgi:hypothetical protein